MAPQTQVRQDLFSVLWNTNTVKIEPFSKEAKQKPMDRGRQKNIKKWEDSALYHKLKHRYCQPLAGRRAQEAAEMTGQFEGCFQGAVPGEWGSGEEI